MTEQKNTENNFFKLYLYTLIIADKNGAALFFSVVNPYMNRKLITWKLLSTTMLSPFHHCMNFRKVNAYHHQFTELYKFIRN